MENISDVIKEAVGQLPEDACITITIERGDAYVELTMPDDYGDHTCIMDNKLTLTEQVRQALTFSKEDNA